MKSKRGYRKQKPQYSTGRWLKRYFAKRTCRRAVTTEAATENSLGGEQPDDNEVPANR